MTFLAPAWLAGLALLPVAYALLALDDRQRRTRFDRFAREALWKVIVPELDPRARLRKARIWLLALAFTLVALARPQWGAHEETIHVTGLDVMITLDVSSSMETEDVVPSRLKKAKHLIKSLVDQLHGDRVGLVAFAGSASVACPLTTDTEYLWEAVQIMTPKMVPSQGTDIGLALDRAQASLERGGEGPTQEPEAKSQIPGEDAAGTHAIILISDGEDHEGAAVAMARKLAGKGTRLYVLGVGTQKGGPIPLRDENGTLQGYKRERGGQTVVSQFHPDALSEIASAAGGRYWNVTPGEGELQELLEDMGRLKRTDQAERTYVVREDHYQIPLGLAILLLLTELSIPARRVGVAMVFAATLLGGTGAALFGASKARAEPLRPYFENEQGLKAFKEGKLSEARQRFGTAQALEPDSPELDFNEGVVQMQEGQVDAAIRDFEEAARSAASRGNPGLAGRSLFNLGIADSKKGDMQGAVRSYIGAIQAAHAARDRKLEEDARKNLEYLVQQQEQQKQKSQQGKKDDKDSKDDKNKSDEQKQDESKDGDKKDGQKDGQGQENDKDKAKQDEKSQADKDKPKKYQDNAENRRKPFRSQKLSDEDAERVMAELKNRERNLQVKMKRQNANSNPNLKDW